MPNRNLRPLRLLATVLVGIPVAVLLVWPQALGAQMAPLVTQLVAFRALLALLLGGLAVVAAAVALSKRRWGIAAGAAIVLGAVSIANVLVLTARGAGDPPPDGDLTVLAWNTEGGDASPESIARLVLDTDADIVSLPETGERAVAEVTRLLAQQGRQMSPDTAYGESGRSWLPTSVLIADDLGEYRVDAAAGSTPDLPSAVWRPADGTGPVIVAAHPRPPLLETMDQWRAGLEWVAAQCNAPDVIVAGDLNATIDHLSGLAGGDELVGDCEDAAAQAGVAATGTWPSSVPAWLATPIDHVLVGSSWAVRGAQVITSFDEAGSDHRPIVAVLDRRSDENARDQRLTSSDG